MSFITSKATLTLGAIALLALTAPASAGGAACPQLDACEIVKQAFLADRGQSVIHLVQDLPADLQAALIAATGTRLIANRPTSGDLVPVSHKRPMGHNEHQVSTASAHTAAIVYRTGGISPRHLLLLFTRDSDGPMCRFHLKRPVTSAGAIRSVLQEDFARSLAVHPGC